ncbi:MAG: hypothetical protein DRM98_05045 [Thermoplasmata archaeon]|nr:MAG: hypothetical protein DRM98_05045 [Thermoplasmata archaeon]
MGEIEETLAELKEEIRVIKERLVAVEKEQRRIREDILSGAPQERMQKRILEKPPEDIEAKKEKIAKQIKIEI